VRLALEGAFETAAHQATDPRIRRTSATARALPWLSFTAALSLDCHLCALRHDEARHRLGDVELHRLNGPPMQAIGKFPQNGAPSLQQ
jgi:hypothetical protein